MPLFLYAMIAQVHAGDNLDIHLRKGFNLDFLCAILLIVFAIAMALAYHVFPRYVYMINGKHIDMRRYVFKHIAAGKKIIKIDDIEDVYKYRNVADLVGSGIWGALYFKPAVIIKLKNMLVDRYYVTPEDPDLFMKKVKELIATKIRTVGGQT